VIVTRRIKLLIQLLSASQRESRAKIQASSEKLDRFQCRLRFCDFQSIETPWDSNSAYESSGSDD
jgi:hypothetical protein